MGMFISDWTEGQSGFIGYNSMTDHTGAVIALHSTLTLIDISSDNPLDNPAVPEPSTVALMGLGLAGIACFIRRPRV